jgi:hypothetical protein
MPGCNVIKNSFAKILRIRFAHEIPPTRSDLHRYRVGNLLGSYQTQTDLTLYFISKGVVADESRALCAKVGTGFAQEQCDHSRP